MNFPVIDFKSLTWSWKILEILQIFHFEIWLKRKIMPQADVLKRDYVMKNESIKRCFLILNKAKIRAAQDQNCIRSFFGLLQGFWGLKIRA